MKVCPKCKSTKHTYMTTFVGYVGRDENKVNCMNPDCGWTGLAYELIEVEEDVPKKVPIAILAWIDEDGSLFVDDLFDEDKKEIELIEEGKHDRVTGQYKIIYADHFTEDIKNLKNEK